MAARRIQQQQQQQRWLALQPSALQFCLPACLLLASSGWARGALAIVSSPEAGALCGGAENSEELEPPLSAGGEGREEQLAELI